MTETIRCVCGRPAVCQHKAGLDVFFVRADGTTYDDPDADCYLCGDCCGHSGEEGPCYRITDGVPMNELDDD
jgi:hypothetical protein